MGSCPIFYLVIGTSPHPLAKCFQSIFHFKIFPLYETLFRPESICAVMKDFTLPIREAPWVKYSEIQTSRHTARAGDEQDDSESIIERVDRMQKSRSEVIITHKHLRNIHLRINSSNRTINSRNPFASPFPSTPAQSDALYAIHRNPPPPPSADPPIYVAPATRYPGLIPKPNPSQVYIPFALFGAFAIVIAGCFYLAYRWARRTGLFKSYA